MNSLSVRARLVAMAVSAAVIAFVPARVARAEEALPDLLTRVGASVVRVRCGEAQATGFVVGNGRQVVTAFSAVNARCEPLVSGALGGAQTARVSAWSEADGLALLELGAPLSAPALTLEEGPPVVGAPAICLGYGMAARQDGSAAPPPARATPRFGALSVIEGTILGVDVRVFEGDRGAPIFSAAGKVLGVVSGAHPEWSVPAATRVNRLSALLANAGRQGRFAPHPAPEVAGFGGLFLAVQESNSLLGAGIASGFRHDWFALSVAEGFLRKDFVPIAANVFEARRRYFFELYGTFDWRVNRSSKLDFGPGIALDFDAIETRRVLSPTVLETDKSTRFHPRPLVVLEFATSHVFLRMPVSLIEPAARFDIGIVFNR